MKKITFNPNVPVQIALKYDEGKLVEGRFGDQVLYTLTDGRCMYLDTDVAAKVNLLEIRRHQPFNICKRWTGRKGDAPQWDIWRDEQPVAVSPALARAVAATGIPPSEVELGRPAGVTAANSQAGAGVRAPAPAVTAASEPPQVNNNGNGSKPANGNGNGMNGHATHNGIPYWDPKTELSRCYDDAIEVLVGAREHAAGKGLPVQFTGEDLRQVAATLYIDAGRDKRTNMIRGGVA